MVRFSVNSVDYNYNIKEYVGCKGMQVFKMLLLMILHPLLITIIIFTIFLYLFQILTSDTAAAQRGSMSVFNLVTTTGSSTA